MHGPKSSGKGRTSCGLSPSNTEVATRYRDARDESGRARLLHNGYLPARTIHTGIGEVVVKAPRGYATAKA